MRHFAYWTLRLAYWSFRLRDISPTGQFAYWTVHLLDISPTAWTVCLQIAHFVYKTSGIKSDVYCVDYE